MFLGICRLRQYLGMSYVNKNGNVPVGTALHHNGFSGSMPTQIAALIHKNKNPVQGVQ